MAAIKKIKKITKNIKKRILAIPAEAAAIPVNPNTPAIIEMIKNINAQYNMAFSPMRIKFSYILYRITLFFGFIF